MSSGAVRQGVAIVMGRRTQRHVQGPWDARGERVGDRLMRHAQITSDAAQVHPAQLVSHSQDMMALDNLPRQRIHY